MNLVEFIKACTDSGYSSKKVAEQYAEGKTEFTSEDFIEVWRINERKLTLKNNQIDKRFRTYQGAKTTKKLIVDWEKNQK